MKTTTIRRAVLSCAVMFALLFSPANALVVRADDGPGHGTPGKAAPDTEDPDGSWYTLVFEALETLELLLPV